MAARTSDQILEDFKQAVSITDPSADAAKGPLFDLVARPLAQVIAPTEIEVDRLAQIYSTDFVTIGTADEAQAFLTNWGEAAGVGTPSRVRVFFVKFNRPSTDIFIPQGSVVSNSDGSRQYITVESGLIQANFADTFFNPVRRAYEIGLNCIATQNGPEYDLPAGRISRQVTQITGIDVVENRENAVGGVSAETPSQQISRVREKLTGLAINTPAGTVTRIRNFNPALITDVKTVLSSDRNLFARQVFTPASDYYIIGSIPQTINETFTASGGETEVSLQNVPVFSVSQVLINGLPTTDFFLEKDTTLASGLSAKALDKVILATPLLVGDVVLVTLQYNSLLQSIQAGLFGVTRLRNVDELARSFFEVPLNIEISGKALPSFDPTVVQNNLQDRLQTLINTGKWVGEILPETILQDIKVNVAGLTSPVIRRFQRSRGALEVIEPVVVKDNELATFDITRSIVTIRNS